MQANTIISNWKYTHKKRFLGAVRVHKEYPNFGYFLDNTKLPYYYGLSGKQKKFIKRQARYFEKLVAQGQITKIQALCLLRCKCEIGLRDAKALIEA